MNARARLLLCIFLMTAVSLSLFHCGTGRGPGEASNEAQAEVSIEAPDEAQAEVSGDASGVDATPDVAACTSGATQACQRQDTPCAGTQQCNDGQWSDCVAPNAANEECNGKDDDCDGRVDEDLTQDCYSGPAATKGVGVCKAGTQTCRDGVWGPCRGETAPIAEDRCFAGTDDNCDGQIADAHQCSWAQVAGPASNVVGGSVSASPDLLVAPNGDLVWLGYLRGDTLFSGRRIKTTSPKSMFIARYKASGELRWVRLISTASQKVAGVLDFRFLAGGHAIDDKGNVYVFGDTNSLFKLDDKVEETKGTIFFLYKYDPNGVIVWKHIVLKSTNNGFPKRIPFRNSTGARSIVIDEGGRLFLSGWFLEDLSYQDATTNKQVTIKSTGQYRNEDIFLTRIDPATGGVLWVKTIGGTSVDKLVPRVSLVRAKGGGVILFGESGQNDSEERKWESTYDITAAGKAFVIEKGQLFAASFDAAGDVRWLRATSGKGASRGRLLLATSEGLLLGGTTTGDVTLFDKAASPEATTLPLFWMVHLDHKGKFMWQSMYPSDKAIHWYDGALGPKGGVYLTGAFAGSLTIGSQTLQAASDSDLLVARLDVTSGKHLWTRQFGNKGSSEGHGIGVDPKGHIFVQGMYWGGELVLDGNSLGALNPRALFLWKMMTPSP